MTCQSYYGASYKVTTALSANITTSLPQLRIAFSTKNTKTIPALVVTVISTKVATTISANNCDNPFGKDTHNKTLYQNYINVSGKIARMIPANIATMISVELATSISASIVTTMIATTSSVRYKTMSDKHTETISSKPTITTVAKRL